MYDSSFQKNYFQPTKDLIWVINAGSSSIKFSTYECGEPLHLKFSGLIDKIGKKGTDFIATDTQGDVLDRQEIKMTNRKDIINFLIHWVEQQDCFNAIKAVGHRVVQGMHYVQPERLSKSLVTELRAISAYAPEHLPCEREIMEAIFWRHPTLTQIACFDTAFHHTLPKVAKLLPLPRRLSERGIQHYGFHGLSYTYLLQELKQLGDPVATEGRVILAHLGNGVSMSAVLNGKSIDTTMCFSPTGGLPMSTRSGDLDPGLVVYLMQEMKMNTAQFQHMVNYESGLLGISETSSDMRDLLASKNQDSRAADAIALFCYQAKKTIGAYAAALGGLDALVFTGGIGENAPSIRAAICEGLEFLGIEIDEASNLQTENLISTKASRTRVRVIHTNEELMIAQSVFKILSERPAQPIKRINEET